MTSKLPLSIDDLLRQRTVEGERIEYKTGWNPDAVVRTLRAFANDFENLGGGYIVVGQDCDEDGCPVSPRPASRGPVGLYPARAAGGLQSDPAGLFPDPERFEVRGEEPDRALVPGRHEPPLQGPAGRHRQDERVSLLHPPLLERRIREFLKELDLTEGRATGIPKIRRAIETNGSPPPRFSTDEARSYFLVELPVYPELAGVKAHDEAHHDLTEAEAKILSFVSGRPKSRSEIAEHLGQKGRSRRLYRSIDRLRSLGFVELTVPEKPQSRNQKIRLTEGGEAWLATR